MNGLRDNAEAALRPPIINTEPDGRYAPSTRIWQGIPGIERAANGRLWAVWYTGGAVEGPDNYVQLITSDDDGETWSPPVLVIDPPGIIRAFDPVLWHDPTGRMWLFFTQAVQYFDGRFGVWAIHTENSGDAKPKWSAARRLANGLMMNKPTVLSDGAWLMPAAIWSASCKEFPDPPLTIAAEQFSNIYRSRDAGQTWTLIGRADVPDRNCDEHMIIERRDRSLWMLVRCNYGIGQSTSTDGGVIWSPGSATGIAGTATRFFIRRLRSGKLLLVYHDHPSERSHLTAWLSDDDGRSWRGKLLLDERFGVSYPDAIESPEGLIYLIYDRERHKQREILMARFTEADVERGRAESPRAALRMLVNKAG